MHEENPDHPRFHFRFQSDIDGFKSLVITSTIDMTGWRLETEWLGHGDEWIRSIQTFDLDSSVPHLNHVPWSATFDFPQQRIVRWIPPGED